MSSPSPRIEAALAHATTLARTPLPPPARSAGEASRCFALGDPQATCAQLFGALDAHGLLGEHGSLAEGASLLSIGDHFDFGIVDRPELLSTARADGVRFLRWLAEHPADRVTLLLGNHDTARVMELARLSDAEFAEARALAADIEAQGGASAPEAKALCDAFTLRFPEIPTPGIASRDFGAFTEEQRDLVIRCLLAGRFRLAAVGKVLGREVLFVHAGVTRRELALLGIPDERDPKAIARALNRRLAEAVEAVRARWERGERVPLDLSPLHLSGVGGVEGGGLLYHRPANPAPPRSRPDLMWQFNAQRPRRFDPRALPEGLAQAVGHTSHKACVRDLEPWFDPADPAMTMDALVPLRTLRARDGQARYETGIVAGEAGEAVLHLFDPAFYRQKAGEAFSLLPVEAWVDID